MTRSAVLVVSFGTSYTDSLEDCIESTERRIHSSFAGWDLRRAFTSEFVISKLAKRDNLAINNVRAALQSLADEKYSHVVVQPLHIIPGFEYHKVVREVDEFQEKSLFASLALGAPLLFAPFDYEGVIRALEEDVGELDDDEAVLFMGHGTDHFSNACYHCLQTTMDDMGLNFFVSNVMNTPALDQVAKKMERCSVRRVRLMPLMLVASDHVRKDMIGPDSWESYLDARGFQVRAVPRGLGQNKGIQELFVKKANAAVLHRREFESEECRIGSRVSARSVGERCQCRENGDHC